MKNDKMIIPIITKGMEKALTYLFEFIVLLFIHIVQIVSIILLLQRVIEKNIMGCVIYLFGYLLLAFLSRRIILKCSTDRQLIDKSNRVMKIN